MTLRQLARKLDTDIQINCSDYTNMFHVSLYRVEIKEGIILSSIYGVGKTKEEAAEDYCDLIRGDLAVVRACTHKRVEFQIPNDLEVGKL